MLSTDNETLLQSTHVALYLCSILLLLVCFGEYCVIWAFSVCIGYLMFYGIWLMSVTEKKKCFMPMSDYTLSICLCKLRFSKTKKMVLKMVLNDNYLISTCIHLADMSRFRCTR